MTTPQVRAGGYLCGQVRYTAPATPSTVAVCHCRACQKQAGTAFSIIAAFPSAGVTITGNLAMDQMIADNGALVGRFFCGACGSPIHRETTKMKAAGMMLIKAGTLDDVSDLKPASQHWTNCKQNWLTLADDLPAIARG